GERVRWRRWAQRTASGLPRYRLLASALLCWSSILLHPSLEASPAAAPPAGLWRDVCTSKAPNVSRILQKATLRRHLANAHQSGLGRVSLMTRVVIGSTNSAGSGTGLSIEARRSSRRAARRLPLRASILAATAQVRQSSGARSMAR